MGHFWEKVAPFDPLWGIIHRRAGTAVTLTVYRASAFFGVASVVGWMIWALAVNEFHPQLDWSVGGPQWAPKQGPP